MNNKKKRDRAVIDGEPNPDMERREMPHIAIVTLKLDVRAIFPNGLFDKYVMGDEALRKYGLAQKGQFVMRGYSEFTKGSKITGGYQWQGTRMKMCPT